MTAFVKPARSPVLQSKQIQPWLTSTTPVPVQCVCLLTMQCPLPSHHLSAAVIKQAKRSGVLPSNGRFTALYIYIVIYTHMIMHQLELVLQQCQVEAT